MEITSKIRVFRQKLAQFYNMRRNTIIFVLLAILCLAISADFLQEKNSPDSAEQIKRETTSQDENKPDQSIATLEKKHRELVECMWNYPCPKPGEDCCEGYVCKQAIPGAAFYLCDIRTRR